MCYNTDSKKVSVILLRAKDLNRENAKETGENGYTMYILIHEMRKLVYHLRKLSAVS